MTKLTKQQKELARMWPYLSRWDRWWVIWEITRRLIWIWLRSIPQRWAEWQLRRIRP